MVTPFLRRCEGKRRCETPTASYLQSSDNTTHCRVESRRCAVAARLHSVRCATYEAALIGASYVASHRRGVPPGLTDPEADTRWSADVRKADEHPHLSPHCRERWRCGVMICSGPDHVVRSCWSCRCRGLSDDGPSLASIGLAGAAEIIEKVEGPCVRSPRAKARERAAAPGNCPSELRSASERHDGGPS